MALDESFRIMKLLKKVSRSTEAACRFPEAASLTTHQATSLLQPQAGSFRPQAAKFMTGAASKHPKLPASPPSCQLQPA